MDQVKIGKYIAEKRKAHGMTQVELADRLDMSNKSVSKWERGVCLPDVSVYEDLCRVLDITINEFLAGEDIEPENVVRQSEKNIINVTSDSKEKRQNLKKILALSLILIVLLCGVLGWFLNKEGYFLKDYLKPYEKNSAEYKMATMLVGQENTFLYTYSAMHECKNVTFNIYEYKKGKLITEAQDFGSYFMDEERSGSIAVVPDIYHGEIKLIASTDTGEVITGTLEISKEMHDSLSNCAAYAGLEDLKKIESDKEYNLCALYSGNDIVTAYSVDEAIPDDSKANDYTLLVTVKFGTHDGTSE